MLNKHYRSLLNEPIGMLGDVTPLQAVKTAGGCEHVVAWLKYLESHSVNEPDQNSPMATYDFLWMWQALGIEHRRK